MLLKGKPLEVGCAWLTESQKPIHFLFFRLDKPKHYYRKQVPACETVLNQLGPGSEPISY